MKNKTKALIITYTCAAFIVLAGYTFQYKKEADSFRNTVRYSGMQAMSQLADSMNDMSESLILGVYSYSPELLTSAAAKIWNDAMNATASLASMPLWNSQLEKTRNFINQAGDYAYYIAHHASTGAELEKEEREQLENLAERTRALSEALYNTEADFYSNGTSFISVSGADAVSSFEDMEEGFEEFTFLEYDGALSENARNRGAGQLANEGTVDRENAAKTAAEVLSCVTGELIFAGENSGDIPAYIFEDSNGGSTAVTVNGGHVLSVKCDSEAGDVKLKASTAIEKALKYLEKIGYSDMEPVYYQIPDGFINIEFVSADGGVRSYPDRIRVTVSLYDGTVTRVNASEYLVNHRIRENSAPVLSDELPDFMPDGTQVRYVGPAIVASPGMRELYCREFLCRDGSGREFTMYLDAETGEQMLIKLVDTAAYGTFVV